MPSADTRPTQAPAKSLLALTPEEMADMDIETFLLWQQSLKQSLSMSGGAASQHDNGDQHAKSRNTFGGSRIGQDYFDTLSNLDPNFDIFDRNPSAYAYPYPPRSNRHHPRFPKHKSSGSRIKPTTWLGVIWSLLKRTVIHTFLFCCGLLGVTLLAGVLLWVATFEQRNAIRKRKMQAGNARREMEEAECMRKWGMKEPPGPFHLPVTDTQNTYAQLWSKVHEKLAGPADSLLTITTILTRIILSFAVHLCKVAALISAAWFAYRFLLFWTKEEYEKQNSVDFALTHIIHVSCAFSVLLVPLAAFFGLPILVDLFRDNRPPIERCELCTDPVSAEETQNTMGRRMCEGHREAEEAHIAQEVEQREEQRLRQKYRSEPPPRHWMDGFAPVEEHRKKYNLNAAATLPSGEQFRPVPFQSLGQRLSTTKLVYNENWEAERAAEDLRRQQAARTSLMRRETEQHVQVGFGALRASSGRMIPYHRMPVDGWGQVPVARASVSHRRREWYS